MFTQEQWKELLYDGFWQTVKNCAIILKPMLPGIIASALVALITLIIKKGFLSFLYQYLILIGNTKKTAKKKVSKAKNVIDLGNSANDIHTIFK